MNTLMNESYTSNEIWMPHILACCCCLLLGEYEYLFHILRWTGFNVYWILLFECNKEKEKKLLWKHEITFSVINSSTTVNGNNGHTSKSCQHEKIEMCTTRASYGFKSVLTA